MICTLTKFHFLQQQPSKLSLQGQGDNNIHAPSQLFSKLAFSSEREVDRTHK